MEFAEPRYAKHVDNRWIECTREEYETWFAEPANRVIDSRRIGDVDVILAVERIDPHKRDGERPLVHYVAYATSGRRKDTVHRATEFGEAILWHGRLRSDVEADAREAAGLPACEATRLLGR